MLTSILILNTNVYAKNNKYYVIPGGESIGLQLNTGVHITGKFEVVTSSGKKSPWENSNIDKNDLIYSLNNQQVNKITDIQEILSKCQDQEELELGIVRNGKSINTKIKVSTNSDNKNSIGLYVKDKIVGVGTLTYIDPNDESFGALGHSVTSKKEDFLNISGEIMPSFVEGIRKAIPGTPGEKRAILKEKVLGEIEKNNDYGIFGDVTDKGLLNREKMEVGHISEIKLGKATILTVTDKDVKESYEIEIIELKNQVIEDVKGIKFKVTDKKLLEKTGGIIQGMSGSPIIQNNKIIGAVSHVIVDNPEFGYGVYLDWMLKNK